MCAFVLPCFYSSCSHGVACTGLVSVVAGGCPHPRSAARSARDLPVPSHLRLRLAQVRGAAEEGERNRQEGECVSVN